MGGPESWTVGDYELGRTIGAGAFGKVKLCQHITTGAVYAVKAIPLRSGKVDTVRREVDIQYALGHCSYAVGVVAVMTTEKFYYVVTEYMPRGDIFSLLLQSRRFPESKARKYFVDLVRGVRCCHRAGYVHRDIKPENILIDANDTARLADYGLAVTLDELGKGGARKAGTPNFCSPEIMDDKCANPITFATDVWSCAVTLFVMLTGTLPFRPRHAVAGNPERTLTDSIVLGEYDVPRHVSEKAKSLIAGMLVVDATKRMTVDDILSHPWCAMSKTHMGVPVCSHAPRNDGAIVQKKVDGSTAEGSGGGTTSGEASGNDVSAEDLDRLIASLEPPVSKKDSAGAEENAISLSLNILLGGCGNDSYVLLLGSEAEVSHRVKAALGSIRAYTTQSVKYEHVYKVANSSCTGLVYVLKTCHADICLVRCRQVFGDKNSFGMIDRVIKDLAHGEATHHGYIH